MKVKSDPLNGRFHFIFVLEEFRFIYAKASLTYDWFKDLPKIHTLGAFASSQDKYLSFRDFCFDSNPDLNSDSNPRFVSMVVDENLQQYTLRFHEIGTSAGTLKATWVLEVESSFDVSDLDLNGIKGEYSHIRFNSKMNLLVVLGHFFDQNEKKSFVYAKVIDCDVEFFYSEKRKNAANLTAATTSLGSNIPSNSQMDPKDRLQNNLKNPISSFSSMIMQDVRDEAKKDNEILVHKNLIEVSEYFLQTKDYYLSGFIVLKKHTNHLTFFNAVRNRKTNKVTVSKLYKDLVFQHLGSLMEGLKPENLAFETITDVSFVYLNESKKEILVEADISFKRKNIRLTATFDLPQLEKD